MSSRPITVPLHTVRVNAAEVAGPLETWRHTFGHGGINSLPLPKRVVEGVQRLRPRLIRTFIQEYFRVYEGSGRFHWERLDPYMDALAATGAKVVAAICIKPQAIFPEVDAAKWRPRDVGEWQRVVAALVRRYSVERPIVTHWEIGNETDIGEDGGCPYLIQRPEDYAEYYDMTVAPILEAFPQAQVGGPAVAGVFNEPLPGLIRHCAASGQRLDFISWHLYHSDPALHDFAARHARSLLEGFPGRRPQLFLTEFNRRLGELPSLEESAFDTRRAGALGAILLALSRAGVDATFHYHMWDQLCFHEDFAPIFSPKGLAGMTRHWNEVPHRLGLFGVGGEVRPQYFVYEMLRRLGDERLPAQAEGELGVLAGRGESGGQGGSCEAAVFLVNYSIDEHYDRAARLLFTGLAPGRKKLTVYRIDDERRWEESSLALLPVEQRDLSTDGNLECHVLLPADSVALACLAT